MFEIPSVDGLSFAFCCRPKKQRVVDASTRGTDFGGALDGLKVFMLLKGHESEAALHLLNKEKGLFRRNRGLQWKRSHTGIDFSNRM